MNKIIKNLQKTKSVSLCRVTKHKNYHFQKINAREVSVSFCEIVQVFKKKLSFCPPSQQSIVHFGTVRS